MNIAKADKIFESYPPAMLSVATRQRWNELPQEIRNKIYCYFADVVERLELPRLTENHYLSAMDKFS